VKTSVQRFPEDRKSARAERRRSERIEFMVRVDYKTVDELFSEFARNINEGGMFVETDTPPEPGSPVALQFRIPGSDEPIAVMGRVVRTTAGNPEEPPGMGIEFENLDAQSRELINQLVRSLRVGAGE
jgi:type IV pilus assembly protein PilZ